MTAEEYVRVKDRDPKDDAAGRDSHDGIVNELTDDDIPF